MSIDPNDKNLMESGTQFYKHSSAILDLEHAIQYMDSFEQFALKKHRNLMELDTYLYEHGYDTLGKHK